jgi:uncharacterized protein YbjT (DUF2867 family)
VTTNARRPAPLTDAVRLAAIAAGRVVGEASAWWCGCDRRVTAAARRLQARGLVAAATPPPAGRITAQLARKEDTPCPTTTPS